MARSLKRIPLEIVPGTHAAGTDATQFAAVRCISTDKIYFKQRDGQTYIRPIPPWNELDGNGPTLNQGPSVNGVQLGVLAGIPKAMCWHIVGGTTYLILGTTRKLFAITADYQDAHDITPLRTASTAAANSIATTNLSADIVVTLNSHGLLAGDYVQIAGAANTGGILAANINQTYSVKSVTNNTFTVTAGSAATSTVSGGGGAGVTVTRQVIVSDIGDWSFDAYGNLLILCPGNGGAIYEWSGTTSTLPTKVANSPTANWVFVSNNAVVALGAGGTRNRIQASGIGAYTEWTEGALTTAWQDDAEGVGAFVCSAKSRDTTLLFTGTEVLAFKYVDLPNLWDWEYVMRSDGIASARAWCEVEEAAYWIGKTGLPYWFDGSTAAPLPNNTMEYYMRLVAAAGYGTAFCRPVPELNQVWFYPSDGQYVIFDYLEGHFTSGTHNATAAENPARKLGGSGTLTFAYGTSDTADAHVYYLDTADNNAGYEGETAGNEKCSLRTAYRSLDENRAAEVYELQVNYGPSDAKDIAVTLYTADEITGGVGDGGMTTGTYTYSPNDATLLVDAAGKYWSWAMEIDQSTTWEDFTLGKMVEGVQPGYPL